MAIRLARLIPALIVLTAGATAADAPQGYTPLEGEPARRALAGTLLRIAVREIVRADQSKATVYRDIDYPVREAAGASADQAGAKADESGDGTGSAAPMTYVAWVLLGPEYEDPAPRGSSPSPNRLRAPGPAAVNYEWDHYKETDGRGDEVLRLELDFSGTHVAIRRGYWQMEAEAGGVTAAAESGYDFVCEQGAYGTALGRIETRDLWRGAPDEITVTLVRRRETEQPQDETGSAEGDATTSPGGTGTYRLKRVAADDV